MDFDSNKMLPQKVDITKTDNVDNQNLIISGKSLPYQVI
jgi:hypothetical protein